MIYFPNRKLFKKDIYIFVLTIIILCILWINSALCSIEKRESYKNIVEGGPHLNKQKLFIVDYIIEKSADLNYHYDIFIEFHKAQDCESFVNIINREKGIFSIDKNGAIYDCVAYLDFKNARICKLKCKDPTKVKIQNDI